MAIDTKQELHDTIDRLSEEEARSWSAALRGIGATGTASAVRPLTDADVLLTEPVLPDDESADDMIGAVRRWRREGGHA